VSDAERPRVTVVTGGAAGIGAAIAESLGRHGAFVVTVDPGVALDGSPQEAGAEPTTAQRIVTAGGRARASNTSVTDAGALVALFTGLVEEFGALDAVVNVAGISRPTGFAHGAADDWRAVLDVHLQGYLNVLGAALPLMAAAGHGQVLGVTSGSGWRAADAGAYSCAKRAVAALTWQLGAIVPPGVAVNALSPIAATRMVLGALARSASSGTGNAASGGVALGGLPPAEALGPVGAYLASDRFASRARGQIVFSNGAELAHVAAPHVIEVVDTTGVASLPGLLDVLGPTVLVPAEVAQQSTGGGAPRLAGAPGDEPAQFAGPRVAIVTDDPVWELALLAALDQRGCTTVKISGDQAERLRDVDGRVDAVIVARGSRHSSDDANVTDWAAVLADHAGLPRALADDAMWVRAVADLAGASGEPTRVVTLVDATTSGGRTRAQVAAQLSRAGRGATAELVDAFAIGVEHAGRETIGHAAELAAYLAGAPDVRALSGAELVVARDWLGLRGHPRPAWSASFAGPDVPDWIDDLLDQQFGATARPLD